MKKISLICIAFLVLLSLSGCNKQIDDIVLSTGSIQGFTTSYVVGNSPVFQKTLYGTVISDSTKNILTNRGGVLEYLDCQPGKEVYRDTIIAKIQANPDDPSYQNGVMQLSILAEQFDNLTSIFSLTEDTLALQKTILQEQYNNATQLLINMEKSQDYSTSNIDYQQQLLEQQSEYLRNAKTIDLDKMKLSISTAYKQYLIMIKDALKKVNDAFTNTNYTLSDKDIGLRQEVLDEYDRLADRVSDTMSASQFSAYLADMSDFMGLATKSVVATTPSVSLPQSSSLGTSIDGLYTTFTTLATTFMGSKSAFDALASSYDSVKNTYNNQIRTVDINTENLEDTTAKSATLQMENQKASLELTKNTLATQLISADDNKHIQLASIKNQLLTFKQNIAALSNSLDGEVLYAGVDGIVKMRALGEDNKVSPNTLLCQITPKDPSNTSIQVFSYQRLALGSKVSITDEQGIFLGTGIIIYEYPYKDPASQNYIYEIPVVKFLLKENQKVLITSSQSADKNQIWIPLQYISPRLEGNLVRRKVGSGIQNIYVTLGNINDSNVQVLSGLNVGDEIVQ